MKHIIRPSIFIFALAVVLFSCNTEVDSELEAELENLQTCNGKGEANRCLSGEMADACVAHSVLRAKQHQQASRRRRLREPQHRRRGRATQH